MSNAAEVRVECYSGGRADERPRRVQLGGDWRLVTSVLGAKRERDAEVFDVLLEGGEAVRLRRSVDSESWFLERRRPQ